MIFHKYFIFFAFLGLISCDSKKLSKNQIVAKVDNKHLYLSEMKDIIPNDCTKEDSMLISENYIHQWIKKQLLISMAELNLSEKEKDVSKLVDDYRSSLIIHKYQQQLVKEKLDTIVNQHEIEKYYTDYNANFILSKNIVKALYIKIPIPVPNLEKIQKLYKSNKDEDWEELQDYCFLNATKFDNFNEQWIYAQNLLSKVPVKISSEETFLRKNKNFEAQDSVYHYFVKIEDYRLKNTQVPLVFVQENIRRIILNKRKIQFIKNMEDNIFREAQTKNKFTIY